MTKSLNTTLVALSLLLVPAAAGAATRTFSANSIIIPMDMCYQTGENTNSPPAYCVSPYGTSGMGVIAAYGLVYRLLARGYHVYVIANGAKATIDGVDFSITASAGTPVQRYNIVNQTTSEFYGGGTSISYRGGPFIIDASEHDAVLNAFATDPVFATDFDQVQFHVAKQSFQAPVSVSLGGTPAKLAILDIKNSLANDVIIALTDAKLNRAGDGGTASGTLGGVWDKFSADANFTSGMLGTGGYAVLWANEWDGSTANRDAVVSSMMTWLDGNVTLLAKGITTGVLEQLYLNTNPTTVSIPVASPGHIQATAGLVTNGLSTSKWGKLAGEDFTFGDLSNPLVQYGNWMFEMGKGNAGTFKPHPTYASIYRPGVVRLLSSYSATTPSDTGWDFETVFWKDNDETKGRIVYFGGDTCSKGKTAWERIVLNTLFGLATMPATELARSSPVIYSDGTTFQGTYMRGNSVSAYPPIAGHFHSYPAGALAGSNVTAFGSIAGSWDAATLMPSAGSRVINTVATVSGTRQQVAFTVANVAPIATAMGLSTTAAATAISGIRAGGLGGIDHSTPAIIPPSTVAGSANRPTVAYVGSLDGMLHCIGVSGTGVTAGQEVWAFIPPSQLATIATYAAGVDGSPQVSDAFVDPTSSGVRSWRTLLAVTNGAYGGTVDVLDVTDPLNPAWLWTGANTNGTYAMGAANGAAFGMVQGTTAPQSVLYLATQDAGSAGNGFNLYALDAGTGAVVWQWDHLYTRHMPGTATLVPNDVPGVPSVINTTGDGGLDNCVFYGDLDGKIWAIDAARGTAPSSPLYDAGADGYPINAGVAIYRDKATNHVAVAAATGGKDWIPSNYTEFVFGVDTSNGTQLFKTNFAAGERVYAAPTIAGNDVYFITSLGNFGGNISSSLSDVGNIQRVNLSTGAMTLVAAVKKGDSEVAVDSSGNVVAASALGETQNANGGRDAQTVALSSNGRPFTVQAWLDLH